MDTLKIEMIKLGKSSSQSLHHDDEVSIIESDKFFSGKKTNIDESQYIITGDYE